jgi:hypothetical protein
MYNSIFEWDFKIASSRWCGTRNDGTSKVNSEGDLNKLRKLHSHCEERSDEAILQSYN